MPLNPLDWTGGQFLTLYIFLAGAAWLAVLVRRSGIGDGRDAGEVLGPLELAYLSYGPQRVGDAILAGLLSNGAASVSVDGKTIEIKDDVRLPPELAFFTPLAISGGMTRTEFQKSITPHVDSVRSRLEKLGLVPNAEQASKYSTLVLKLFATPLILGAIKTVVGLLREKPVSYLVILLIITFIVFFALSHAPLRTEAGTMALRRHRVIHSREARAPLENEFMLGVALAGLMVLSGTQHDALYAASRQGNWGNGGGGGGGSDGGAGGDGGGCGGCGGGGCGGGG